MIESTWSLPQDALLLLAAEWWTGPQAGLIGGVAGSAVGILGGLVGTVGAWTVQRGKYKPLLQLLFGIGIVTGVAALTLALVALASGQPYHVWYPPLLIGIVGLCVFAPLYFVMMSQYAKSEARRLDAQSVRRGA